MKRAKQAGERSLGERVLGLSPISSHPSHTLRGRKETRRACGFTLMEIMMVVAILGLTLTMGVPALWKSIRREGMGKVEQDLIKGCQEARRAAIMNNQDTFLVIRPHDRTITVGSEVAIMPDNVIIDSLGVNFVELRDADEARVKFTSQARSDEFTILMHGVDGRYREITLDTVTALVQVENIK